MQDILFKDISYLDENFELQSNYDILIKDGKYEQIVKTGREMRYEQHDLKIIKGSGLILLPGFYNVHSHVPMTLMRSYGEGLKLQDWLNKKIFPFEAKLSENDVYYGSLAGMAEMLASGTVAYSDMYMKTPTIFEACREVKMAANIANGCTPFDRPIEFEEDAAYRETVEMLHLSEKYRKEDGNAFDDDLIKVDLALHAEYTSNLYTARSLAAFAKEKGLIIQVHLSETRSEHEESKARNNGMTPTAYLHAADFFENRVVCAHCVYLEESDYRLFKELTQDGALIFPVHNPRSNLKLASGFADLKKWLAAGLRPCIATDGASSNNNLDYLEELSLASLLQKGVSGDPLFMSPAMSLEFACLNGAKAQGRSRAGLIKEGYDGSFALFDMSKYYLYPKFDELSNLLYAAKASDCKMTAVRGEILYEDGEFKTIDIEKVKYEVAARAARLAAESSN